jgi:hypothetical protein
MMHACMAMHANGSAARTEGRPVEAWYALGSGTRPYGITSTQAFTWLQGRRQMSPVPGPHTASLHDDSAIVHPRHPTGAKHATAAVTTGSACHMRWRTPKPHVGRMPARPTPPHWPGAAKKWKLCKCSRVDDLAACAIGHPQPRPHGDRHTRRGRVNNGRRSGFRTQGTHTSALDAPPPPTLSQTFELIVFVCCVESTRDQSPKSSSISLTNSSAL